MGKDRASEIHPRACNNKTFQQISKKWKKRKN